VGPADRVGALLGWSLGLCGRDDAVTTTDLVERFRWQSVPCSPWTFTGAAGA
jgi:hypothetical protein